MSDHINTPTRTRPDPPNNRTTRTGWILLVLVAVATIVVPILLDGVILRGAHMENPAWLPHAKLHTAMAFFAGTALGVGALICLLCRPVTDRFSMAIGGYLAAGFWLAVLGAGCWPGTSYFFVGDPVYSHPLRRPETLGMPNNVATAVLMLTLTGVGLVLVFGRRTGPTLEPRLPRTCTNVAAHSH